MSKLNEAEYWVSEHMREYLHSLGFHLPLEAMEGHVREWHSRMQANGVFYDYMDRDGFGRVYEVHRRSIHPAMRVCSEWGSLLLNDKTRVVCESQECPDWLADFFSDTGFMPQAQNTVVQAFGMGTGAWALWVDADVRKVRVRHYDARMVIPLTRDEEGASECAFVMRAFYRGRPWISCRCTFAVGWMAASPRLLVETRARLPFRISPGRSRGVAFRSFARLNQHNAFPASPFPG